MLRRFLVVVGLAALGAGCAQNGSTVPPFNSGKATPTLAPLAGTITEFSNGITATGHSFITAGPDGNMWFTEGCADRIGRITPSGTTTEFPLPPPTPSPNAAEGGTPSSFCPLGITAGPDGNLWFTENRAERIGRITPAGVVTEFSAGISPQAGPYGIAPGPDGNLWFTEPGFPPDGSIAPRIGRITTSGVVTEFSAGLTLGSYPQGITPGPDGNMWFAEYGQLCCGQQGEGRIGRITPAGAVTEFTSGISYGSGPSGIAAGPDGNLWFTENHSGKIGRITVAGSVTEFAGLKGSPVAIAAGPDGNLWFTEDIPDAVGRITIFGVITEFQAGLTPNSSPYGIAQGPGRTMWFTEAWANRIGRVQ